MEKALQNIETYQTYLRKSHTKNRILSAKFVIETFNKKKPLIMLDNFTNKINDFF